MDYIPSVTEIETLRKYIADVRRKDVIVMQWQQALNLPEAETVLKAFKQMITYRIERNKSKPLNDDINNDYLLALPIEKITTHTIDHPGLIERFVDDYEKQTKVVAKDKLFKTKLGEMTGYQFREYLLELGFKINPLSSDENS